MRKIVGFGLLAGLALVTPALAGSSTEKAPTGAPLTLVATNVDRMGYDVQSVRKRNGLYHANLLDRDTGKVVHAEFRTEDGELISARLLANDEERHDKDGKRSDADRREGHRETGNRD